jgi:hypothetical protein
MSRSGTVPRSPAGPEQRSQLLALGRSGHPPGPTSPCPLVQVSASGILAFESLRQNGLRKKAMACRRCHSYAFALPSRFVAALRYSHHLKEKYVDAGVTSAFGVHGQSRSIIGPRPTPRWAVVLECFNDLAGDFLTNLCLRCHFGFLPNGLAEFRFSLATEYR